MDAQSEEIKKKILELRDWFYNQAKEDAHDERDQEAEDHLEREYNSCDTDKLVDSITDLLLDSFGS